MGTIGYIYQKNRENVIHFVLPCLATAHSVSSMRLEPFWYEWHSVQMRKVKSGLNVS